MKSEECKMERDEKNESIMAVKRGEDVGFERIRRITGYLVGTLDRFNDAKRAEEHDRVKHGLSGSMADSCRCKC
jgi:anaerobic ribonucleoside-triphosphate reductase